jgi:hypothetical protein
MIKYLIAMSAMLISVMAFSGASDDNEINIDQSGDTLTLYIDQIGYGNKVGGDDFSTSSSASAITGSDLTFDIDQVGNSNLLFGTIEADSSTYNLIWTGDSNSWDWNIGYVGSADSSTLDVSVTGDSNTMDFDQGYVSSAERLDLDLTVIGSSNVFDVDVETDDVTFTVDVTGDSNDINTLQNDGFYQTLTFDLTGDNADVDINQISGTCPVGITTCKGIITMEVVSEDATIQINQKDTAGDS